MIKLIHSTCQFLEKFQLPKFLFSVKTKPWNVIKKLKNDQLEDIHQVNRVLKIPVQGRTQKSQIRLMHGKQPKTGFYSTHSENKIKRKWHPNVCKRYFYSNILKKKIHTIVTMTTLRQIDKYGSFDNYILLCPSQKMDSMYGEYLRMVMLKKLNNPNYQVPYIAKQHPREDQMKDYRLRRWKTKVEKGIYHGVWFPPNLRYQDFSEQRIRPMNEMSRVQYNKIITLEKMAKQKEDIQQDHPLLKEIREEALKEMQELEPERQKALKLLEKCKSKKILKKILEVVEQGKKDFYNLSGIKQ